MKKQNKKKNNRIGRNIYGPKCIAKEVILNKETALDQYIEILNDIELHRQKGINLEYDVKMPTDVFSQEEITDMNRKMSNLMMLRYGISPMNIGQGNPIVFPAPSANA